MSEFDSLARKLRQTLATTPGATVPAQRQSIAAAKRSLRAAPPPVPAPLTGDPLQRDILRTVALIAVYERLAADATRDEELRRRMQQRIVDLGRERDALVIELVERDAAFLRGEGFE